MKRLGRHPWLLAILTLSLALNLYGNRWGLPERWHPDELADKALSMAESRSINPGQLSYGGMHYFTLGALAVAPAWVYARLFDPPPPGTYDQPENRAWSARLSSRVTSNARTVSGLMGTLIVLIAWGIGTLLYSRPVGVFAALFLAVSPVFVVVGHFATVDMAANLWYWLACLFCVLLWKRGTLGVYLLAAAIAGVAIGTKLDRGIIVLPFLLAHYLRGEGLQPKRLIGCAFVGLAAYALVNPLLLVSPFDFVDGIAREMSFSTIRTHGPGEGGFTYLLLEVISGMSWPVFGISAAGLGFALVAAARGRYRRESMLALTMVLPFAFIYGPTLTPDWYVALLMPALALFGGLGVVSLGSGLGGIARKAGAAAVAGAVAFALLTSVAFDLQFTNDSRYLAAAWIGKNVPAGASIEVGPRPPLLPPDTYRITKRPFDPDWTSTFLAWREDLERDPFYNRLRTGILRLERILAPRLGLAVGQPYEAWFDRLEDQPGAISTDSSSGPPPTFRVAVDYVERPFLDSLVRPGSNYRKRATFRYVDPFGLSPRFTFLNPAVLVFERESP